MEFAQKPFIIEGTRILGEPDFISKEGKKAMVEKAARRAGFAIIPLPSSEKSEQKATHTLCADCANSGAYASHFNGSEVDPDQHNHNNQNISDVLLTRVCMCCTKVLYSPAA